MYQFQNFDEIFYINDVIDVLGMMYPYQNIVLFQIVDIQRPVEVPQEGLLCDILWSDPDRVITIIHYLHFDLKMVYQSLTLKCRNFLKSDLDR